MDPRFVIAETQDELRKAGADVDAFWDDINNCTGPDHAIQICHNWMAKIAS